MNSCEHGEISDEAMLDKEKNNVQEVKEEMEDVAVCGQSQDDKEEGAPATTEVNKRSSAEFCSDTHQSTSSKRPRVSSESRKRFIGDGSRRNTPSLEQQVSHGNLNQLNLSSSILSSNLQTPEQNCSEETFPNTQSTSHTSKTDSSLYPLIEKMFFILNSLNSSMTQLHSKVDLLTLEVMRIKKQIKQTEMVTEFQPPLEYQLTHNELNQLMEQTASPGELSCQLLVHLFPELFKARECSHECMAGKRTLESLHLQLIRNYVERDMESARLLRKHTELGAGTKADHPQSHSINEQDQGEHGSVDNQQDSLGRSDIGFSTEELDELSSPDDFVILLVHRLFPEVFEEAKIPEGCSSLTNMGQVILESDKMEILRKYMETYFPDVPEESWLQVCIQHVEYALEGPHSNGNGSETDNMNDEGYDLASLPDEDSILKVPEYDRPSRKSKKSLLPLVDFDSLEIPSPDFPAPQEYMLTREQLKSNYECSLSIGNFASRLLVLMFPELFTHENTRKQYNCSGSLGKKQLDPVRVSLIRHYVQLVYPQAKNNRVWMLEFVGKLDERCRRRDTEQRRSYLQQRKVYSHESEQDFLCQMSRLHPDNPKEDPDIHSLPPEKSSKDFCKIPLEELTVSKPDFPVPSTYLLSDTEIREIVQQSLSVGNFAARLLVRLFPELFTQENLRLQYNHSGACNKKQLDPVRLRLIRHYVEAVYPVDKMEEVWHYECVPSIDERCRRPNRKKCDILKKAKRSSTMS
ncbi:BEN domain-containing protein 3 [Oryzias latipes]|uniref:BEN domain containing 3 n=1 Tax=Oryzias latipes TaxID=8090 RepID=A0A3B3HZB4_ORYLA